MTPPLPPVPDSQIPMALESHDPLPTTPVSDSQIRNTRQNRTTLLPLVNLVGVVRSKVIFMLVDFTRSFKTNLKAHICASAAVFTAACSPHPYCISTNKCCKYMRMFKVHFPLTFLIASHGVGRFTIATQQRLTAAEGQQLHHHCQRQSFLSNSQTQNQKPSQVLHEIEVHFSEATLLNDSWMRDQRPMVQGSCLESLTHAQAPPPPNPGSLTHNPHPCPAIFDI
jgi:hypothetical protein